MNRDRLPAFDFGTEARRYYPAALDECECNAPAVTLRGTCYPDSTESDTESAPAIPHFLKSWGQRCWRFVDLARTGHWQGTLMPREHDRRTFVDPQWDARDLCLMREWTFERRYRPAYRGYKRAHYCKAFIGCDADEIRSAAAMESIQ